MPSRSRAPHCEHAIGHGDYAEGECCICIGTPCGVVTVPDMLAHVAYDRTQAERWGEITPASRSVTPSARRWTICPTTRSARSAKRSTGSAGRSQGGTLTTHRSEAPGVIVCYSRCWSCMSQQCPGGWHTWADDEDIEHARRTNQSDPAKSRCACKCAEGPVIEYDGPPDLDEPVSLNADPCPLCGERGPCEYDAEGRPLIHALDSDDLL